MGKIIFSKEQSAAYHLALEAYLHEQAIARDESFALIYVNRPTVVYGRAQNPYREVDWVQATERGVALHRRISGGGAVYHDEGVLNYAFFVPRRQALVLNYAYFLEPLRAVLRELGLASEILRKSNLYVAGRKISGNAQALGAEVIMSHGTILFSENTELLEALLHSPSAQVDRVAVPSDIACVKNLREILAERGHELSLGDLTQLLLDYLERVGLGGESFQEGSLSPELETLVRQDYLPRFLSRAWNFGRTAPFQLRISTPEALRADYGEKFPRHWQLSIREAVIESCRAADESEGAAALAFGRLLENCPLGYKELRQALAPLGDESVSLWLPAFSS